MTTPPEKKRRGRPQLDPDERRDAANTVSMTHADRAKLEAAMKLVPGGETSLTNFIRRGALFWANHLEGEQHKLDELTDSVAKASQTLLVLADRVQKLNENQQGVRSGLTDLSQMVGEVQTALRTKQ